MGFLDDIRKAGQEALDKVTPDKAQAPDEAPADAPVAVDAATPPQDESFTEAVRRAGQQAEGTATADIPVTPEASAPEASAPVETPAPEAAAPEAAAPAPAAPRPQPAARKEVRPAEAKQGSMPPPKHSAQHEAPKKRTYTVKSGDTLSAIGQRFGVNWRKIAEVNKIPNPDLIYPGQVFVIPED